ncbi:MAG: hypothetical protein U1F83_00705 [Verrucomicrobiota bacterium]
MPPPPKLEATSPWFKAYAKSSGDGRMCQLNEEALRLFPVSEEERRLKSESLMAMPEFVP